MLSEIKHKLILFLQLLLVITYIIFEELIWEGIVRPLYQRVHALKILQKLEVELKSMAPSLILVLFVILFVIVEAFGIYAGILFVSGQVLLGSMLYIAKIPVAAFTFWLFRVTEAKLMQFGWFRWIYEWLIRAVDWLESCEMHKRTMAYLAELKMGIKAWKERYFSAKSPFIEKIKHLYRSIKGALRK